ncbi:alpha/beta fold hydrolase [Paenibacillus sp. GCM10027626]|uniref:alpha/beta fold hydrolase n=1 Tax=Paenibacillus sp. GCM10027626 TaxID=3273411 RepID=UPI00362E8DC6
MRYCAAAKQVKAAQSLGDMPLIVVTGGTQPHHTPESWSYWMKFQQGMAKLSSKSKHIIVEDAGHAIHVDQPDAVINVIKDMVAWVNRTQKIGAVLC